jgi:hypothetical protein
MKTQIHVPEAPSPSAAQKSGSVIDERPNATAQAKLQEMAASSPQARQLKALQNLTASHSPTQRAIDVALVTDSPNRKTLRAQGTVGEFAGGSAAGNRGWVNVDKYRGSYVVKTDKYIYTHRSPNMPNNFTTPERGHALANQNGGNGGDPKNVFAQDGGSNNGPYKSFENTMRRRLDRTLDHRKVTFSCYLEGKNIVEGNVADAAMDEASEIDSD